MDKKSIELYMEKRIENFKKNQEIRKEILKKMKR